MNNLTDIQMATKQPDANLDFGLFIKGDKVLVSSLSVAKMYKKTHDNVIKAIRAILKDVPEVAVNFNAYSYKASNGKENPCYEMDRQGFSMLVMGFTGAEAKKFTYQYTTAFEEMIQELKQPIQTNIATTEEIPLQLQMIEGLVNFAKSQYKTNVEVDERLKALEEQKPKEIIVQQLTLEKEETSFSRINAYSPTAIGKAFNLSGRGLNEILIAEGVLKRVLYRRESTGVVTQACVVTDKYRNQKYTLQKYYGVRSAAEQKPVEITFAWTPKGVGFIVNLLKYKGYKQYENIDNRTKAR